MSKRKSNGRISVEDVGALFQRSLELLHEPPQAPTVPPGPPQKAVRAPSERPVHREVTRSPLSVPASLPQPVRRVAPRNEPPKAIPHRGAPSEGLLAAVREAWVAAFGRSGSPTTAGFPKDLVDRAEESLLEAGCIVAELQRKHHAIEVEYGQALRELRDVLMLVAEQIDPDASRGNNLARNSTAGPKSSNHHA